MTNKSRSRNRKGGRGCAAALLAAVILGAAFFAGGRVLLQNAAGPVAAGSEETVLVTIPEGSGTGRIAGILAENGLIRSQGVFKLMSRIKGNDGQYKAGTFALSPSMDMETVMGALKEGVSAGGMVTIPEGYTMEQTAELLEKKGRADKEKFLEAAASASFSQPFVAELPPGAGRLEGFLFPETYNLPMGASETEIINILLNQFDKEFTGEFEARAREMGLTTMQVVTVASMIEREVRLDSERPLVASVVYNRLKTTMPLQFCSTVQYALGEPKKRLLDSDLKIASPYNTYTNSGLPPGPICSPGRASLKAALYPADTDYLYFVVDPESKGGHRFSSTYEQFLRDKENYLRSL